MISVGDVLYSLNVGNAARRGKQTLTPMYVTKVGRKYFWAAPKGINGDVKEYMATKFYIDGLGEVTEYTANHKLYINPSEWEEEKESGDLCKQISSAFEYGKNRNKLPLESLRIIAAQVRANSRR